MTDDRIAGTATNLGGKAQEAHGSMTGNRSQEAKGKLNQAEGMAQDLLGQAKDVAQDTAKVVSRTAKEADDYVRSVVEERPYTIALCAFAAGLLLGRMSR